VSSLFHRFHSYLSSPIYKSGCVVAEAVWLFISLLRFSPSRGESCSFSQQPLAQHEAARETSWKRHWQHSRDYSSHGAICLAADREHQCYAALDQQWLRQHLPTLHHLLEDSPR